jgi:hypothetical protein
VSSLGRWLRTFQSDRSHRGAHRYAADSDGWLQQRSIESRKTEARELLKLAEQNARSASCEIYW